MADAVTETKPVEVVNPPVAEATSDKTSSSDANVETLPTNESATEEKPDAEPIKQEEPASESTKEGDAAVENEADKATVEDDSQPSIFRPPPGMLRVSGRNQQKKFVKSDPTSLPETDDPREIRKQVRYSSDNYTTTQYYTSGLMLTIIRRRSSISAIAIYLMINFSGSRLAAKQITQFHLN